MLSVRMICDAVIEVYRNFVLLQIMLVLFTIFDEGFISLKEIKLYGIL